MNDMELKATTQYMLNLLEEILKTDGQVLSPVRLAIIDELNEQFHEKFDKLPHSEQLAFVALLMTTETLSMRDCETLLARAEQNELARKAIEAFEKGYIGVINPLAPAAPSIRWDSIP